MSTQDVSVGMLVRTIEHEIIPRLMLAHRADPGCLDVQPGVEGLSASDIEMFTKLVLSPDQELASACVNALRHRGVAPEDICLGLLAPVARRLGALWMEDLCDFADVTMGLGRLQRILRELGPEFEPHRDTPANGYRVLLLPAQGEQHTFGLVMVAEFFRHAGWEVEVGLAEGGTDAIQLARTEWFDLVGFSVGVDSHVATLKKDIAALRKASMNRQLCIMLGGSLLQRGPDLARQVGADLAVGEGRSAPALAEEHLSGRGRSRPK